MDIEKIIMTDGTVVELTDVVATVSGNLFQSELHYGICFFMAEKSKASGLLRQVIENLYYSKSQRIRLITAAVWFVEYWQGEVSEIVILNDIKDVLENRGFSKGSLKCIGEYSTCYIDKKHTITLLFKSIVHRVFRVFSRPVPPNASIVRGWVDVTKSMYSTELEFSELRIFPFPLGVKRQIKFINMCRRSGLSFSVDGLPYSICAVLKAFFIKEGLDIAIASIEIDASQKYAIQLLKYSPTSIYTSDEFEAGAIAMYELLISAGVNVVNTAHGVGLYCPNVAYTKFISFTYSQGLFYSSKNKSIKVSIRENQNSVLPLMKAQEVLHFPLVIVLLHQNFEDYGLFAEAKVLEEIASAVVEVSAKLNIPFIIKLHPNSDDNLIEQTSALGGILISNWSEIKEFRPVFITINSTAFFDTMPYGPTLVYKGPSFFPEVYFGSDFIGFKLGELEDKLRALVDSESWLYATTNKSIQIACLSKDVKKNV